LLKTTFEPTKNCNATKDILIEFFQNFDFQDPNITTIDMVDSFLMWLTSRGLVLQGKTMTVELLDDSKREGYNELLLSLEHAYTTQLLDPLIIMHGKEISFKFLPACEHVTSSQTEEVEDSIDIER
jgi:hypothetical protein